MTVPRYGEQRVEKAPLPTLRVPTNVPIDALGAFPRVNLQPLERSLDDLWTRAKAHADQIAVTSADAKAAALETKLLYDPQTGLLNLRGRDALKGRETFDTEWQKAVGDITKDLHNDTQRDAFQRSALGRYGSVQQTLARHISSELEKYDDETTRALLVNESNAAVAAAVKGSTLNDVADRATMAIARQRAAILDYAARKGLSPERRQEMLANATSATHAQVIDRLLANEDDGTALRYFSEFRDQLVGKDLVDATKAVDAGSTRAESQRQGDRIVKTATSLSDGLKQAAEIQDPRLREATETRVRRWFDDQATSERQERLQAYQEASRILEQTHDTTKIPLSVRMKLSPEENDALQRREHLIRHPVIETNLSLYSDLINRAALNDATRQEFLGLDLTKPAYRNALSDADYRHLLNLQRSLRAGDERSAAAQERREESAQRTVRHREETAVLKAGAEAQKEEAARRIIQGVDAKDGKTARPSPPPPRIRVPQWMVDSARVDPDYKTYLEMHGVRVDAPTVPTKADSAMLLTPKVPGGPIVRPQ